MFIIATKLNITAARMCIIAAKMDITAARMFIIAAKMDITPARMFIIAAKMNIATAQMFIITATMNITAAWTVTVAARMGMTSTKMGNCRKDRCPRPDDRHRPALKLDVFAARIRAIAAMMEQVADVIRLRAKRRDLTRCASLDALQFYSRQRPILPAALAHTCARVGSPSDHGAGSHHRGTLEACCLHDQSLARPVPCRTINSAN